MAFSKRRVDKLPRVFPKLKVSAFDSRRELNWVYCGSELTHLDCSYIATFTEYITAWPQKEKSIERARGKKKALEATNDLTVRLKGFEEGSREVGDKQLCMPWGDGWPLFLTLPLINPVQPGLPDVPSKVLPAKISRKGCSRISRHRWNTMG